MDINKFEILVNKVTANVLDKIDPKSNYKIGAKSCLIVMPSICIGVKEYFEYITKNYTDHELYLGVKDTSVQCQDIEQYANVHSVKFDLENSEFVYLLDSVESVIVVGLKINQMKALTQTDDTDEINHLILSRLMVNKSVSILMNTNKLIYNRVSDTIIELEQMGIKVSNIQQRKASSVEKIDLITENYVVNLKKSGVNTLVIDKKQLITPLAKDKLRDLKIKISYNEEDTL